MTEFIALALGDSMPFLGWQLQPQLNFYGYDPNNRSRAIMRHDADTR
jgi:hypothetical protein